MTAVISWFNVTGHDRSRSQFLVNLTGHKNMTMVMTVRNPDLHLVERVRDGAGSNGLRLDRLLGHFGGQEVEQLVQVHIRHVTSRLQFNSGIAFTITPNYSGIY